MSLYINCEREKRNRKTKILLILLSIVAALIVLFCTDIPEEFVKYKNLYFDNKLDLTDSEENNLSEYATAPQYNYVSEEIIEEAKEQSKDRYYYKKLSYDEKQIYCEIYACLTRLSEDTVISTKDKLKLDKCFRYVVNDYPEIFYVLGYTYNLYETEQGDNISCITGIYSMNSADINVFVGAIPAYVSRIKGQLEEKYPDGYTDYDAAVYIYNEIASHTLYSHEAPYSQSIVSVIVSHTSVCQGYAKTAQYVLNKLGVPTSIAFGTLKDNQEAHAWNIVLIDDEWYHMDITWGDSSLKYKNTDSAITDSVYDVDFDYCLVPDEDILKSRTFEDPDVLPDCYSRKHYYYYVNGEYFTDLNKDQLAYLFNDRQNKGETFVTIKASDEEVYKKLKRYLVDDYNFLYYCNSVQAEFIESKSTNRMFFKIK